MKMQCGDKDLEEVAVSIQTPCERRAFVVSPHDNVATLLENVRKGEKVRLSGDVEEYGPTIVAKEEISSGHKIALISIQTSDSIMKYGYRIGHATRPISPGEWIHLHNCASDVDERSHTLDIHTGAPQDTKEAYV